MKKLPDDFKINVLLPGAVWLLVSAFIGYAVVAGMGSDAITVILFVVITFVLFVMPMAVYMEYRERIENWLGKRERRTSATPVPSADGQHLPDSSDVMASTLVTGEPAISDPLPPDFPDALRGEKTIALLDALRREGFLNKEYRPHEGCNATQMAFIADSIAEICNVTRQWKTFGDYWHLENMRQLLDARNRRCSKVDKEDVIIQIFKRAAEENESITNTDTFRHWLRNK